MTTTITEPHRRAEQRRYEKSRLLAIHRGTWQAYDSAEPARDHILQLRKLGYSYQRIADLAGVALNTVRNLSRGLRYTRTGPEPVQQILRSTADKILALPLDDTLLTDANLIDATQTWHLVDQLRSLGWANYRISIDAGLGHDMRLTVKRPHVTVRTARRIEALHERVTRSATTRPRLDIDELELLIGTDTAEQIAARVGYGRLDSLITALDRRGRGDLITRLRRTRQVAA